MQFCKRCGALITPGAEVNECEECVGSSGAELLSKKGNSVGTELEKQKSTKSGAIRKRDAVEWLSNLDRPNSTELKRSILPKPVGFEGSKHPTDISTIRLTGDARFIETVAGLFKPILDLENDETRVEINLQRTKERDTQQFTGNYALYLSVAERGG